MKQDSYMDVSICKNIRGIRKEARGENFTVKYVVAEINKGLPVDSKVTEGMYYKWENEERVPTAKHIPAIARALGVSESELFHWKEVRKTSMDANYMEFCEAVLSMDEREREVLMWLVTRWKGDAKALIEFALLYADLPTTYRRDVAGFGVRVYDVFQHEKKCHKEENKPDIEYLKFALNVLWKN